MSNTTLNQFVGSGTAAEMAAFTPTPPTTAAAPDSGYFYFQTDTNNAYSWNGATWILIGSASSIVVQVKNTQTGAVNTGTTQMPFDDSIPQNNEGDEYMTLAITPVSATNKLKIDVVCFASHLGTSVWQTTALFKDSTADALAANSFFETTATAGQACTFTHYMTSGTTSAITFKVRCGANAATTTTFNGQSSARRLGGVMASSITITEIIP